MTERIPIPIELLEQFERGNVLLFIGEGINRGVLPSSVELAKELAARCNYPPDEPLTLPRVAGYYEMTRRDRQGLIQFLRERLDQPLLKPLRSHKLVAQLRPRVIVTTCYDRLLERALQTAGIPATSVVGNAEIAYADENKLLLVWLWGVLDQPDSIIVTEDDRRLFLEDRANLSDVLRGELARRTWLFVGFGVEDEWFRSFYDSANRNLDRQSRRSYIFGSVPGAYTRAWWETRNAEILSADVEAFLLALTDQLAERTFPSRPAGSTFASAKPPPLPDEPYKALVSYEANDRAMFFGRGREIDEVAALIHAHRLMLLYGASGVGKTSLLQAGIIPRLEESGSGYMVITVRALTRLADAIHTAVQRRLPETDLPMGDLSLFDFLSAVVRLSGQRFVVVIDQFEEFFIRLSPEFRTDFIAELSRLYDATDLPVKVVLALREDYLASVGELEQRIPEVFRTRTRLLPLTRQQAKEAIVSPAEAYGYAYELVLVDRLLDDLTREGVMPLQLQLVCNALFHRARSEQSKTITSVHYEALGGARAILRDYLKDELQQLGSEAGIAKLLLEELITSQGTRATHTADELADTCHLSLEVVSSILDRLVRRQLLKPFYQNNVLVYELAHEYLVEDIWLSAEVRARKQAEELLSQTMDNWQRLAAIPSEDTLTYIKTYAPHLRLNSETEELMLRSALRHGQGVGYWFTQTSNVQAAAAVVTESLLAQKDSVRTQALAGLRSTVADIDKEHSDKLVELLLRNYRENPQVRQHAASALWLFQSELTARNRLEITSDVIVERIRARTRQSLLPITLAAALVVLIVLGFSMAKQVGVFAPSWGFANGPTGGAANSIAVDPRLPGTIYVGTLGRGIFKSEDHGKTWHAQNVGLTNLSIGEVAIDPFDPNILYSTSDSGMLRSQDGGGNWTDINNGLLVSPLAGIALDTNTPGLIYIGTWGAGVYKSEDHGQHWIQHSNGITNLGVHDISIDPSHSNRMYAATQQGVFGTTDSGKTWEYFGPVPMDTVTVKVDPRDTNVVYAGVWDQGVFRSDDAGRSWTPASAGLTDARIRSKFVMGAQQGEVYVGAWGGEVFHSLDKAAHWTSIAHGFGVARSIAVNPQDPTNLLLATNNGFFQSMDEGQSWSTSGLLELTVQGLVAAGDSPMATVIAGTDYGVFRLIGDRQWQPSNTGLTALNVKSVFASSTSTMTEYAIVGEGDLFKSEDSGLSWKNFGPLVSSVSTMAIDPVNDDHVVVGSSDGSIYLTFDSGQNWKYVWNAPSTPSIIAFDGQISPAIYIGTENHGAYKSTDYGSNWLPVNSGLDDPTVTALTVDHSSPNVIYVATKSGLSKSIDGGVSWFPVGRGDLSAGIRSLAVGADGSVWVASIRGVFQSNDGGASWTMLDRGLPSSAINVLLVRPGEPPGLYIGSQEGVYRLFHWWETR